MKYVQIRFLKETNMRLYFWKMSPIIRWLEWYKVEKVKKEFNQHVALIKDLFISHYEDYDESVIRDFCDTLITAKNEAIKEGKETIAHLSDNNLAMVMMDLFFAGTETSMTTFR